MKIKRVIVGEVFITKNLTQKEFIELIMEGWVPISKLDRFVNERMFEREIEWHRNETILKRIYGE